MEWGATWRGNEGGGFRFVVTGVVLTRGILAPCQLAGRIC